MVPVIVFRLPLVLRRFDVCSLSDCFRVQRRFFGEMARLGSANGNEIGMSIGAQRIGMHIKFT